LPNKTDWKKIKKNKKKKMLNKVNLKFKFKVKKVRESKQDNN